MILAAVSSSVLATFIAVGTILYLVKCFIDGVNDPKKHAFKKNIDHFDLGYIERDHPVKPVVNNINVHTKVRQKKKSKTKTKTKPKIKNPLTTDCINALVGLGFKKNEAKLEVDQFFTTNIVTTVNEFLQQYFKKAK